MAAFLFIEYTAQPTDIEMPMTAAFALIISGRLRNKKPVRRWLNRRTDLSSQSGSSDAQVALRADRLLVCTSRLASAVTSAQPQGLSPQFFSVE